MYEPLYRNRPHHRWTNGDLAAKVGADLGLPPDEEQLWILDTIYAERAVDRPASFEVAVISPRQNIKTSSFGIAAIADLFVFGVERHLWTAHHGETLKGTFLDFRTWIKSNPEYDEQVNFYEGHQDMAIVHKETGNRIEFQGRTGKAGRGLTGVKRITLDEALYLEPKHMGAVYPTMLTKPEAQVRIASSAGLLASEQLRRIRDRGRPGKDKRLAYLEYGAELKPCLREDCSHEMGIEGCALDDRDLWWWANCALWAGRITEESLADQRGSVPPAEFMREFLSWWEDPELTGGAIPVAPWLALADPETERGADVVFGLDVTQDRDAWLSVAWQRVDGSAQVMLTAEYPVPAHEAVVECQRLVSEWGGRVACSPQWDEELDRADVPHEKLTSADFTVACGALADAVKAGTVRHGNQAALNRAVKASKWRNAGTGGERALQLRDASSVGPLASVARALALLSTQPNYDIYDSVL